MLTSSGLYSRPEQSTTFTNRFVIGCSQDLTHGPLSSFTWTRHSVKGGHAPNYAAGQVGTRTSAIFEQVKWTLANVDTCHFKHLLPVISDSDTRGNNSSASRRCIIDSTPKQNDYYIQHNATFKELRGSRVRLIQMYTITCFQREN